MRPNIARIDVHHRAEIVEARPCRACRALLRRIIESIMAMRGILPDRRKTLNRAKDKRQAS